MNKWKLNQYLLIGVLISSSLHAFSDKIIHEPKAIIALQGNNTAKQKRQNMNDRLALIEAKLNNIAQAPSPANALMHISKRIDRIKEQCNIYSDIDPSLLMGPLERTQYDRKLTALAKREKAVDAIKNQMENEKAAYLKKMAQASLTTKKPRRSRHSIKMAKSTNKRRRRGRRRS